MPVPCSVVPDPGRAKGPRRVLTLRVFYAIIVLGERV